MLYLNASSKTRKQTASVIVSRLNWTDAVCKSNTFFFILALQHCFYSGIGVSQVDVFKSVLVHVTSVFILPKIVKIPKLASSNTIFNTSKWRKDTYVYLYFLHYLIL